MAEKWEAFWAILKKIRLRQLVLTVMGGVAIGVLGNGTYEFLKSLRVDSPSPPAAVAAAPSTPRPAPISEEGYLIELAGRRTKLVTTTADIEIETAWAVHAAFGINKAPPYEVTREESVLRIMQVYITNKGEQAGVSAAMTPSSPDATAGSQPCYNMMLVEITGGLSVPDAALKPVFGRGELCFDGQIKGRQDFINQDVLPLAVARLVKSIDR